MLLQIYSKIKTIKHSLNNDNNLLFGISEEGKIIAGMTGMAAETPDKATILIDILYNTGKNYKKWVELYPDKEFVFLYNKKFEHKNEILKFPWKE